jgi:hypothetical protein
MTTAIHDTSVKVDVLREYEITLRSGVWYLLAPDSEHAAWNALELSRERNDQLLNVRQTDEW